MSMQSPRDRPALEPPSLLEKAAGSSAASVGAAALGIYAGDFAGLLPTLLDSLARKRQMERIESAIRDLDSRLASIGTAPDLSDDQYKVVAEAVAAMYSTVHPEKLEVLKAAAVNAAASPDAVAGSADLLGRLLRDLSVGEVHFIVANFGFTRLVVSGLDLADNDTYSMAPGSEQELQFNGLISLGLIYAREPTWDAQVYVWAPIVAKLLVLLRS